MSKFPTPDKIYGTLFTAIQHSGLFPDDKVIADLIPRGTPSEILARYEIEQGKPDFDLESFVNHHFSYQAAGESGFKSDTKRPVDKHIEILWDVLKREADQHIEGSSLIPLPYPYIVPGGRFNEIYYWDSYFTMLGLEASGRIDMIESMVKNFAYLIDEIGFIPNGNRSYFLGRSQPPFFAMMVDLLSTSQGDNVITEYQPQLLKEYHFWMQQEKRAIAWDESVLLNRYYDNMSGPRQEMYATDLEHFQSSGRESDDFFLHVRAACESGWDFSCRWFTDKNDLLSIKASEIFPVDLNCLVSFLDETIERAYGLSDDATHFYEFQSQALKRRAIIRDHFWSEEHGWFMDVWIKDHSHTNVLSLAGMFPLYFNIATEEQAERAAGTLEKVFLREGGLVSTPYHTGQQWDAPNGWAPLQWMAIQGLRNYGFTELADEIKSRWIKLNTSVYQNTGKMLEKYNVEDTSLLSGGGEYPVQDGFGWSNGVLIRLLRES
jgi:alpha,alpha-trehalase